MSLHGGTLADWTSAAIHTECAGAHAHYERRRADSYRRYFHERPELRGGHPLKARALEQALPQTWSGLAALLPSEQRHRHILSGKSSQALALGLLGPALTLDRSGAWLTALGTPRPAGMPHMRLEVEFDPAVLNEHPRTTAVDFLVDAPDWVLCCEAKWTETGMGTCSCTTSFTPSGADCSERVRERAAYWHVAHEVFGLLPRQDARPCPLHPTYQAVRNVAAALALAGPERTAHFALVYDQENPYFAGAGAWPGWAEMLSRTLDGTNARLGFRAVSWQELVPRLPLDDQVREWARTKHGLHSNASVTGASA